MCGITGKVKIDSPPDIQIVRRMTDKLYHRGPDNGSVYMIDENAVFGHRRLTIIDLSNRANQPMKDHTGRYTIVYNGEVYNFLELRSILQKKKYFFKTDSDTEVVLYSFIHWGTKCFEKFNGMFALSIWDSKEKKLIMARDRFGKKPLYYNINNSELTFASELIALLEDHEIKKKLTLSISGLNHYLAMGYILSPLTIYNEIDKLEPASYICFQNGKIIEHSIYWNYLDCFFTKTNQSEASIVENLDYLIEKAVKFRLISDVPVGSFLSGGLDSSGIAFYAKKHITYEFHSFSVGFNESSYNEAHDAKIVANFLQSKHHEIMPNLKNDHESISKAITCYDEPFSDTSLVPFVFVSKLASQFVKVVLSGDGADEIFAGYTTYRADQIKKMLNCLSPKIRRISSKILQKIAIETNRKLSFGFKLKQFAKGLPHDFLYAHYAWRELYNETERIMMIGENHSEEIRASNPFQIFYRYYQEAKDLDSLSQHLYVDAKTWLADDILVKVDRATMAFGLEARCPYLDSELVEYAASIPPEMKLKRTTGKYILKKTLAKHLPESSIHKRKSGFNAPINYWLGNAKENEFRFFNQYVLSNKGFSNAIKTI
jgi:asparagine synthase (glutamine-hydrolysing)